MSAQSCPILFSCRDCTLPGSLFMAFPRQEYWNGLPFSSPGDISSPGMEPPSPALAGRFFLPLSHLGSHGSKYFIYFFIRNFEIVPYWTLS